jgi:phenylacetate-coenzyme A ligase PaaK-like adenylate-forming protein
MTLSPLHPWIAAKLGLSPAELTLPRLRAWQLQKAQETLRLLRERSPFYRRHLAEAPALLTDLAELPRFPFTTAADLRQHGLHMVCVSQSEIERVVTLETSGTTGLPKRVYFTAADQELTRDFFHHGMSTFTEAGDRVLILLPGERPGSVGDLLAEALPRMGAIGLKHGPGHSPAETLAVIRREAVTGLVGTPTQALALARHPDGAGLRLKNCLLVSDYVSAAISRVVEAAWDCRVFTHYGMTETGLGGGVECVARRGYHLREADLVVEIIHPATGQPLPPGEPGEVVFTTLTRRGMPLFRYRTGDVSRLVPGECPCGTSLPTLARISGRVDGVVNLGSNRSLTMADLDEALFPLAGLLNFTAAVGPNRLELETSAAPGYEAAVAMALRPALESLPAIREAQQAGGLFLSLQVETAAKSPHNLLAKRTIRLL